MSGGGSSPSSNTVTQVQQIPEYEQQFSSENQDLARSLGSQPSPVYQGPLIAGQTPLQTGGQAMAVNASTAYQPLLNAAAANTVGGLNGTQTNQFLSLAGQGANLASNAAQQPAVGAGEGMLSGAPNQGYIGSGGDLLANSAYQPLVYAGAGMAGNASSQPSIGAGADISQNSYGAALPFVSNAAGMTAGALSANPLASGSPANPGVIGSYMSPYVSEALAPQITALQTQLGQEQAGINSQATQAGAFGDARQGAQSALANFYGNESLLGLVGNGYNTAFSNALQTSEQQQGLGLQEQNLGLQGAQQFGNLGLNLGSLGQSAGSTLGQLGAAQGNLQNQSGQILGNLGLGSGGLQAQVGSALGNLGLGEGGLQAQAGSALGNLGLGAGQLQNQSGQIVGNIGTSGAGAATNEQQLQLAGGAQLGNLAGMTQNLGITGANAVYAAGTQQQQIQQQELNAAYQQFLNQTNWPFQMLNVRESALSNSPYTIANATQLPNANTSAQAIGSGLNIAGLLGGLVSGNNSPFGGAALH